MEHRVALSEIFIYFLKRCSYEGDTKLKES